MAKYTVELHDLLINEETHDLIKKALSSYPMYQPIHKELYGFIPTREQLNQKILDNYRFYEIGSETVARFLFNLEKAMNLIMPKYNQLYKSVDIMNGVDDIFGNLDIVETFEQEQEGNSTSNSSGNNTGTTTTNVESENTTNTEMNTNGRNVQSKTPQSQIQVKTIDQITAASEIAWNEDNSDSKSTSDDTSNTVTESSNNSSAESESSSTGKISHTLSRKGNQGVNTYAHDMLEFRQLFLNIEQQIINDPELVSCFMLIW